MALFLILVPDANAYLDPGTGSYLIQMVIAALLGASFAIKNFWMRIKSFIANLLPKGEKDKKRND